VGGAVSVFYEQLGDKLPPGTIVSVGEGRNTAGKLQGEISGRALLRGRRKPATRSHDPRATHRLKKRLQLRLHRNIWPDFQYYLQEQISTLASKRSGLSPQLLLLYLQSLKANRYALTQSEVVAEMQLYNQGIRNFWFTAQFIPPVNLLTTL